MRTYFVLGFTLFNLFHSSSGQCTEAKEFACGFENECPCWRQGKNGTEDDIDWTTGTQVATLGWNSIPRSRNEQNSTFAYAVRDTQHLLSPIPRGAMLISKRIPCTDKPLILKLWHRKADLLPQIRICYKYFNESNLAQCSAEVNGFPPPDWLPITATFPALKREFQIVIQATKLIGLQALVAIDDITLEGELGCGDKTNRRAEIIGQLTNQSDHSTRPPEPAKEKPCQDMKLADSWSGGFNKGVWQICENGTKCKPLKGKPGVATSWDVKGDGRYVLESQKFKLETESVARFEYKFLNSSFTSKLRLCLDSLETCPFIKRGNGEKGDKWLEDEVSLSAGWHKIYFTVTNLKKEDHVKVRRIIVQPKQVALPHEHCSLMMSLIDE